MEVRSPLPGVVAAISVNVGDQVSKGDTLFVVEVMKAQHKIASPAEGKITEICVNPGDLLTPGQVIMELAS